MNNKEKQILEMLRSGSTYKEIQAILCVSPSRIARVKAITNSEYTQLDRGNGSNIANNDSNQDTLRSAGYPNSSENGSNDSIMQPERVVKHEYDKDFLENERRKRENETEANRIRERELTIREAELQLRKQEAEMPRKQLFFRLNRLLRGYNICQLQFDELMSFKQEAIRLKKDFVSYLAQNNQSREVTAIENALVKLINLFSEVLSDVERNPNQRIDIKYNIDLAIIFNGVSLILSAPSV
jgi:hypothetical protein